MGGAIGCLELGIGVGDEVALHLLAVVLVQVHVPGCFGVADSVGLLLCKVVSL